LLLSNFNSGYDFVNLIATLNYFAALKRGGINGVKVSDCGLLEDENFKSNILAILEPIGFLEENIGKF